jgi:4-amino-4-deoxy-L-arabinose transferase-like glycosyltransferase
MKIITDSKWIQVAILAVTIYLSFFHGIGTTPLFDEDEGAFSEATREMIASGNYAVTTLNGAPRYDKPILIYWLQALSIKIFGLNEFAVRFPSSVASTLWALLIFLFTKRLYNFQRAFLSTFFMATTLQITIISKAAIADALLNFFLAASMFCIYLFYHFDRKRYLYGVFVFSALGVITKGPVSVLIPVAVSFIFFLANKELSRWTRAVFNPIAITLFLVIAVPWYVLAYFEQGNDFLRGFFLHHNLNRFKTPLEGHAGSILYYIPVLIFGMIPYTTLVLGAAARFKDTIQDKLSMYCVIWFSFVFVFFSLSGTKLPHYIIYGYTPLFLIMPKILEQINYRISLVIPSFLIIAALLVVPLAIKSAQGLVKDDFARIVIEHVKDNLNVHYILIMTGILLLLVFIYSSRRFSKASSIMVCGFVIMCLVNLYIMPLAGKILQEPVKEAASIAKANNYDVVMWKINVFSFLFYTGKHASRSIPKPGDIVLTKVNKLPLLKKSTLIFEKNGIAPPGVDAVN